MENKKNGIAMQAFFPILATVAMCFLVHGYRFANDMFSHDALYVIVQNDADWEIALGRYFEPVLVFLRGNLCSPWLLGLLQTIWFALSVYLLTDLFHIQDKSAVLAVAGVVVGSETFIALNASFLTWSDLYAFSLFASIFAVWCIEKENLWYALLGTGFIVASLATYQAYVCVTITLMLMLAVLRMCDFSKDLKRIIKLLLYYVVILLLAAVVYYVSWQLILGRLGMRAADTYNGMASVGQYEKGALLASVLAAYQNVFLSFSAPVEMSNMIFRGIKLGNIWKYAAIAVNAVMAITILLNTVGICRRQRAKYGSQGVYLIIRCILIALALLAFPLACNFVCVMSKGMEHSLMLFGTNMLYVFAVVMAGKRRQLPDEALEKRHICHFWGKAALGIVVTLSGILIWEHFIYANQVYLKKSLQEKAAYSLITRIVMEVENTPGYVPGITPVAISGYFEGSPCLAELSGFEDVTSFAMGKTSLTYQGTDYAMLSYYLSANMNLTRVDASADVIRQMPVYPAEGSVSMVDEVLVIKISE